MIKYSVYIKLLFGMLLGIVFATIILLFFQQTIDDSSLFGSDLESVCQAFGYEHYDFGGKSYLDGTYIDLWCSNDVFYCEGNDCVVSGKDSHFITRWEIDFYQKYGRIPGDVDSE